MAKRANYRRIKIHRSYTIEELAHLLGRHKNSVREWIKAGLTVLCDGKRPVLIHGEDARAFLKTRQAAARQKCRADEMYCFRCRQPRTPALGMVDFNRTSAAGGSLTGLCSLCSTTMFKRMSQAMFERLTATLDINVRGVTDA